MNELQPSKRNHVRLTDNVVFGAIWLMFASASLRQASRVVMVAFSLACSATCTTVFAAAQSTQQDDDKFFEEQVEPLLTAKCLDCHSHDAGVMESGLTLDSKSGWQTGGDRGPALVPGKPDESLLIGAVRYEDNDLQMPPDEKLADDEIAILVKWIENGAADPRALVRQGANNNDWWSLQKLKAPEVPGEGHPIDAFIRNRLNEQGIKPAVEADRTTLIRRLYVDVLGYLPTPEEVKDFVEDANPRAYENLVDRLLASPQYGERWARHWLDVIHFADSHGCEHDVKRPNAWRYRDYVIERLNADVPWDRFIREQLAPDVFYPQEPQWMAGLGFIAAGPLELSRAGTAPIAFDYLDRDDIVTQTMAAFVSTTANCARCHTHKFDPITQEDYYALQAVFAGVGKGDIEFDRSTEVLLRRQELQALLAAVDASDSQRLLDAKYTELIESWVTERRSKAVDWTLINPDVFLSAGGATLAREADGSIFASGHVPDQETYTISSPVDLNRLTAIRLEVLKDERLPKNGPGRADNGNLHLSEVGFEWFPAGSNTSHKLEIFRASADFDQEGWTSSQAIDGDRQSGWAIFPRVDESHQIVFELASPVDVSGGGRLAITLHQLHPPKHVMGRFRLSVTDADNGGALLLPADVMRAIQKPADQLTEAETAAVARTSLKSYATGELAKLPPAEVVYGASSWWSHANKLSAPQQPKVVHLLRRGAFDKPVREVGPGALSAIEGLPGRFELADPNQEAHRRAALADWLAHRDNPLTWRSVVNRVWQYHFGEGLCDTPNDFGRMGSEPTHPELLDWLAVWFRDESKGSLKQLHRLILTSDTWKQSSLAAANVLDENNRLLWRMNRHRMDAEVFRDSVLRLSGRLDLTMGGPGIEQFTKTKGPQATPSLDYSTYDWESPGANRRSIYRVVWRGIPDPFMESMDFPDLGLLTPKRGESVSALQALTMFNNDFVLEGSEWLADRVAQEQTELDRQVDRAVELAWLRKPTDDEHLAFAAYANNYGLAAFCRVLLNSNEFIYVE